ncbi:MutS protein 1 [Taxawa tesnikishii (nom. ined.)]|nr:MutS protein 1 [Dothideales sp. JES 119]
MTAGNRSFQALTRSSRSWAGPPSRLPSSVTAIHRGALCRYSQPSAIPRIQFRGAKSRTKVKLSDLPQGVLPPSIEVVDELPAPAYPQVVQQHLNNVRKFQDCVVLTRVGNFYEMYGEQAEQYGPQLNLKVAKRKTKLGPIAMSGFQFTQLDRYLKMLVQDLSARVAISEEIRDLEADRTRTDGLLYSRKITRVVTPGTLIDENFVDPHENNFLLSVHADAILTGPHTRDTSRESIGASAVANYYRATKVGLTWVDLSSGDFFTQSTDLASLSSVLARIGAREVVLDTSLEQLDQPQLKSLLGEGNYAITYHETPPQPNSIADWTPMLEQPVPENQRSAFTSQEVVAGSLLLDYVKNKLLDLHLALRSPVRRADDENMSIDKQSLRGLEISATLREGFFQGCLLHTIRKTVTNSGARLLKQRLVSPSMSISVINNRLDLVSEMLAHDTLREDVTSLLRRTFDILRLLQRFSIGRGDADDLVGLAKTVGIMQELSAIVHNHIISQQERSFCADMDADVPTELSFLWDILQRMDLEQPSRLADRILNAIDEEGLSRQHMAEEAEAAEVEDFAEQMLSEEVDDVKSPKQGKKSVRKGSDITSEATPETESGEIWIMRRNASTTLQRAHADLDRLMHEKMKLTSRLREKLNRNSLTLRWTAQHGHYCHIKGKDIRMELEGARTISSSKSTRSFYLPDWTELGVRIDDVKLRIRTEEQRVFGALRGQVIENLVKLRRNAAVLDELDVACSSATLARERNLIRPVLHSGTTHKIIGGRHPMVDAGLQGHGRSFTANDCLVGGDERILVITGPNMAGKSTYLRQNALITILAQTGCFVPADYAKIGLVDKIFSRVGSADNLYNHQSTFMVEMMEVAEILNQATSRSFVIMDEVGRGTTPADGVAVGFACLHHLHNRNRCRTLFATHFHDLAEKSQREFDGVTCYCTDVEEEVDGSWVYVHKLHKGINWNSHALKVARLAGMSRS